MNLFDLLTPPARRDIKGMAVLLSELKPGDDASVTFRAEKYGVFNIHGPVYLSETVKTLMVGSRPIETGLKPEKDVQAIRDYAPAFEAVADGDDLARDDERDSLQVVAKGVRHGAIVRATFEQSPHGRFTITGAAVSTDDGEVLAVGTWFIMFKGAVAVRLRNLKVIAEAGTHSFAVPKLITSWESDDIPAIS